MRTAVYLGTRNVYEDMAGACKSLLYHRGADRVLFCIEDDTFPEQLPDMVQTVNVSGQQWFDHDGPNYASFWTYMVLLKAALPLMLTGRILVLDIDTVVLGSLDSLWALPPAPVYMTREVGRPGAYYNAGVMLMDCEAFREDAKEIIRRLNDKRYQFIEQDAINDVMRGRIAELPSIYNASGWTVPPDGAPIIRHYAAIRRWQNLPEWQRYAGLSWAEAVAGMQR